MQDTHTGKWVPPGGESLLKFCRGQLQKCSYQGETVGANSVEKSRNQCQTKCVQASSNKLITVSALTLIPWS